MGAAADYVDYRCANCGAVCSASDAQVHARESGHSLSGTRRAGEDASAAEMVLRAIETEYRAGKLMLPQYQREVAEITALERR